MNRKRVFNKAAAAIVSASLILGLAPSIPGGGLDTNRVQAATAETPSYEAYIDKNYIAPEIGYTQPQNWNTWEELWVNTLELGVGGKWLIVGEDKYINSNNTIILAESPILTMQWQSSYISSMSWQSDFGTYSIAAPETINGGYYGGSAVRNKLRSIAESDDTTYFSKTEKSLLNATEVAANSWNYSDTTNGIYTVKDKLYIPGAVPQVEGASRLEHEGLGQTYEQAIYVGTYAYDDEDSYNFRTTSLYGGSHVLIPVSFWGRDTSKFWLRNGDMRPDHVSVSNKVMYAYQSLSNYIDWQVYYGDAIGVRPASNLNLSKIYFLSSARGGTTAAVVNNNQSWRIRLQRGTNDIGSATVLGNNKICVKRGTTSKTVSLIVQGRDSSAGDWYYSKVISGNEDVYYSTIYTALQAQGVSSLDFSKCKIWLEVEADDTDRVLHVQKATTHTHAYDTTWTSNPSSHWHQCTAGSNCPDTTDGRTGIATHTFSTEVNEAHFKGLSYRQPKTEGDTDTATEAENSSTCIEISTYAKYCTVCGYENGETFVVEKTVDHVYKDEYNGYTSLPEGHYKQCIHCGMKSEEEDHIYDDNNDPDCNKCGYKRGHDHELEYESRKEPTCTEAGHKDYYYCADCDLMSEDPFGSIRYTPEDIVLDAAGHKTTYHEAVNATCIKEGTVGYWLCTKCGKYFVDELGDKELTSIVSPKVDHTPGDVYGSDETNHWKTCTVCDAVLDKTEHNFNGNICTICGYRKRSNNNGSSGGGNSSGGSSSGGGSGGGGGGSSSTSTQNSNRYLFLSGGTSSDGTEGSTPGTAVISTGGSWEHDGRGWKYRYTDGRYAAGTSTTGADGSKTEHVLWVRIDGIEWAFGADEYMKTGWVQDADGKWWYLDADRGRIYGWIHDAGDAWYYCDATAGRLEGWFYDTEAGNWYYLNASTGMMTTGWQLIGGKQYCFAPKPPATTYSYDATQCKWYYDNPAGYRSYGSMYVNTITPDNHRVDANGVKL